MDPFCIVVALLLSGVAFRETGSNLVNDFEGLMEEGRLPRLYDELFIEIYAGNLTSLAVRVHRDAYAT